MKYVVKHYPHIQREIDCMDVDGLLRAVICPDVPIGSKPRLSATPIKRASIP